MSLRSLRCPRCRVHLLPYRKELCAACASIVPKGLDEKLKIEIEARRETERDKVEFHADAGFQELTSMFLRRGKTDAKV